MQTGQARGEGTGVARVSISWKGGAPISTDLEARAAAGHVESRSHGDRSLRGSAPGSTGTGKAPGSARLGHGTPRVQAERLLDRVDPPSRPAWPRCTAKLGVGLEANLLGDMPKAAVAADLFTSCSRSYRHRTSAEGVGAHASSQQQYLLSWHEFQHAVASAFPSSF